MIKQCQRPNSMFSGQLVALQTCQVRRHSSAGLVMFRSGRVAGNVRLFPSHSGLLDCFFLFSLCQSTRGRQGRSHDGQAQESRSQQAWPWAQRIHPLLQLWPLSAQGEQRRCRLSSGCKAPLPFGAEMSGQDGCAVTLRAG